MALDFEVVEILLFDASERNNGCHLLLGHGTQRLSNRGRRQWLLPHLRRRQRILLTLILRPVVALINLGGARLVVIAEEVLVDLAVYEVLEGLKVLEVGGWDLDGLIEVIGVRPVDQIDDRVGDGR